MARPQDRRSTELTRAQAWEVFENDLTAVIAQRLEITPREVTRAISDPERVRARVRALPGIAMAVLEIVVDAGGELSAAELAEIARERLGLAEHDLQLTFLALERAALAFSFTVGSHGALHVALLDVSAGPIAAEVRGLTLPDPPDPSILPLEADTRLRDELAALATVAHVPVRLNKDGRPNLTSGRKLAAAIGLSDYDAVWLLERAIDAGALGVRGGFLAPRVDVLRALARGELPWGPGGMSSQASRWTPSDRWIAREALVRALAASTLCEPTYDPFDLHGPRADGAIEARKMAERAIDAAGLARLEHQGHVFVRRFGSSARNAGGDGHVTPSFEVMLGPAADPELAMIVALAAEPVRFDRVLTRKLTPASLSAALAVGLSVDDVVQALERVGRHGLAENVRAMISDWARAARIARLRRVWALEASTVEAADLAARALGASVVSRPTPTLLLVDGELASPETALAKTPVKVSGPVTAIDVQPRYLEASVDPPAWLESRPALELRARARDTRGLPTPPGVPVFGPAAMVLREAENQVGDRRAFLLVLGRLWAAAEREYAGWATKLPASAGQQALAAAMENPVVFMLWLALAPKHRNKALRQARSFEPLLGRDARSFDLSRLSSDGMELLRLTRAPDVLEMMLLDHDHDASDEAPVASAGRPSLRDLEPQPAADVERAIRQAADAGSALWLRVQSKSQGDRIVGVRLERLLARGKEVAVLAVDLETDEDRSFPLANIIASRPV